MSRLADHSFDLLPEYIRDADDGALLAFTQSSVGQADTAVDLLDRGDPATSPSGTCQLADPLYADKAWLDWLGLLSGLRADADIDTDVLRESIASQATRRRGTAQAILDRVLPTLTGTKIAIYLTHVGGDPWAATLVTRNAQTPDPAVTLAAAMRDKPAGVHLTHTLSSGQTYTEVAATYATYALAKASGYTYLEMAED